MLAVHISLSVCSSQYIQTHIVFNTEDFVFPDISQCPGLVEITKATPNWKRQMIETKNREKIEEYVKQILKERELAAKWKNVPEWKRALLMKKDAEEQEKELEKFNAAAGAGNKKTAPAAHPTGGNAPPPPMPKPKGDIVPAALSIDPAELESMPPWKRELLFKREKVPITFSNEFNPDEEDEKNTGGAEQGEEQS
nr:hypothetical protein BaRGS_028844 [Batillaria attramentaria]